MAKPIFHIGAILKHTQGGNTRWKVLGFNHGTDYYLLTELPAEDNHQFTYLRTSTEHALTFYSNIRRP